MKTVLRGKFIALSVFIKKLEKSYNSNITLEMKALEQTEANTLKRSRWQKIVQDRTEINQLETKRTIQRIDKTKSWFFEKINKIDKTLAKLAKRCRVSIQINKIKNEKGVITI